MVVFFKEPRGVPLPHGRAHHALTKKLNTLKAVEGKMRCTSCSMRMRGNNEAAILYERCLYIAGCHYTERQLRHMRRFMGTAWAIEPDAEQME